jgi:hypothetical protein
MGEACGALLDPVIDLGTPERYERACREWPRFDRRFLG